MIVQNSRRLAGHWSDEVVMGLEVGVCLSQQWLGQVESILPQPSLAVGRTETWVWVQPQWIRQARARARTHTHTRTISHTDKYIPTYTNLHIYRRQKLYSTLVRRLVSKETQRKLSTFSRFVNRMQDKTMVKTKVLTPKMWQSSDIWEHHQQIKLGHTFTKLKMS
jgi:hypothetical protein